MTDALLWPLASVVVTGLMLIVGIISLYDVRRERRTLQMQVARLPDACRFEGLREQVAQLDSEAEEGRKIVAQMRVAEAWLKANSVMYEKMVLDFPKLKAQVIQAQEELAKVQGQIDEKEKTSAQIFADHKQATAERQWLLQEIQRLSEVLEDQKREKREVERESADLNARRAALLADIATTQSQYAAQKDALEAISQQQSQAARRLEQVQQEAKELEFARANQLADCQNLSRLKKALEEEKKQLEDEIVQKKQRLKEELDQINKLIGAAMNRWEQIAPASGMNNENQLKELWTPTLEAKQFAGPIHRTEQESLAFTEDYLKSLGLQFPQRAIRAFHTSLKVAESSPLVVLAGISGTGKSELPRRYAEAMGMHSLTLAVQPRWDSPQDMFGFYNYLENRYRATDLARALVQMDRYYHEKGRGYPEDWKEHTRSDRMLLVLLDEMNLARVEYYFSEFLSRLETRRGVNRDNPLDRRKAEILLEVGLQSASRENGQFKMSHQPTLPVFVDTNVLFVGTMNEDESTQTLSDKVVDRANVLRFGRPSKLTMGAASESLSPENRWLPHEEWTRWIQSPASLNDGIRSEIAGWGQKLNDALQSIGRPFAHRTFGAFMSYVANYPGVTTERDAYKHAMADQIEQKVLPKLRGLDPQDTSTSNALSSIRKIITELGDGALASAVVTAQKAGHQFLWSGVDRTADHDS